MHDGAAGTGGGLAVLVALGGACCDEEVGLGAGCCAVLRGVAGGLGFDDDIVLPLLWRASCALMWDHLPVSAWKPHKKANISGSARSLYK